LQFTSADQEGQQSVAKVVSATLVDRTRLTYDLSYGGCQGICRPRPIMGIDPVSHVVLLI